MKWRREKKRRKRQKMIDEEMNCGRTKSDLHHSKYFPESQHVDIPKREHDHFLYYTI